MGDRALKRTWRRIVTPAAPGPWNMALDEALFETVKAGGTPFLRFYSWSPSTLSLGRFQHPGTGLTAEAGSVPRVRRMTGGGAIWHAGELTYSLACRQEDLEISGVKASFEKLVGFLVDTWTGLGWNAHFAKDAAREGVLGSYSPACFAGTEEYDVLIGQKKLGGNAQRRDRTAIFQHGSIPLVLNNPSRLFLPEFCPDPETTTDLEACGWTGAVDELISLLSVNFQSRVGLEWLEDSAAEAELVRAQTLVREKFGTGDWTELGGGNLRMPG